jgi:hypothetical protein
MGPGANGVAVPHSHGEDERWTMSTTKATKKAARAARGAGGSRLLQRLEQLSSGVTKHRGEAGFPDYFTTHDVDAEYTQLGDAILAAKAAEGRARAQHAGMAGVRSEATALLQRAALAIESDLGPSNTAVGAFGLKPRKGMFSARAKATKTRRKAKRAQAKAASTASTAGGTTAGKAGGA